jgi:hypothetical protein
MSALMIVLGGWMVLNGALFAALMLRRDRPEARERLFRWVVKGARRSRRPADTKAPARGH